MTENEIKIYGAKLCSKCSVYALMLNQEINSTIHYIYRTHSINSFKEFIKDYVRLQDKLLKDYNDSLTCVNVDYSDSLKMLCDFVSNYYYSKDIKTPFTKYFDKIDNIYNELNNLEWTTNNSNQILGKFLSMVSINKRWLAYYE